MTATKEMESIISSAIKNSDRILEGGLGTILPTEKTWKLANKSAKKEAQSKKKVASKNNLSRFEKKIVGGEVRYYDGKNKYAIVGRSKRVLWFVKGDSGGWFAA